MPDYPSTNPHLEITRCHEYPSLCARALLLCRQDWCHCTSACFTSFWTTSPLPAHSYQYDPRVNVPCLDRPGWDVARTSLAQDTDTKKFVPLFSVVVGEVCHHYGIIIGTYTGRLQSRDQLQAFGRRHADHTNCQQVQKSMPSNQRVEIESTPLCMLMIMGQLIGTSAGKQTG